VPVASRSSLKYVTSLAAAAETISWRCHTYTRRTDRIHRTWAPLWAKALWSANAC